jgi:hypothetical protein
MESTISLPQNKENKNNIEKTFSNFQKAMKVIKDRLCIWNCCFCPQLQTIVCCESCDIDVHSQVGL